MKIRRNKDGYKVLTIKARDRTDIFLHRLVMEKYLNRPLKPHEVVHHMDGDKSNNHIQNLIPLYNSHYHLYLHRIINAYKATGNPYSRKCQFCKKHGLIENMFINYNQSYHRSCERVYRNEDRFHGGRS